MVHDLAAVRMVHDLDSTMEKAFRVHTTLRLVGGDVADQRLDAVKSRAARAA